MTLERLKMTTLLQTNDVTRLKGFINRHCWFLLGFHPDSYGAFVAERTRKPLSPVSRARIERGALGSLLDQTGPVAESEKYAARVVGAYRSYSGVVGTSGWNRSIMQACMKDGDLVVVLDRNCHKSIEQGLMLTGARSLYMVPTRNRYGIIGPIPPSEMELETIRAKQKPARSRRRSPLRSRSMRW
jgi:hypothetical protein